MKKLNQTSFPNRAVKTFSVATHVFRGIILFTRKSLRWVTSVSMKLSTRDNVNGYVRPTPQELLRGLSTVKVGAETLDI